MTAHQPPKSARAPLGEFPISDKCLGATPQFEDAPAWIYNHDNPYLHGVYAPETTCGPDPLAVGAATAPSRLPYKV